MNNATIVPNPKFDEMIEKISCLKIVEGKNVPTVNFGGKTFVITSAAGTGTGFSWEYVEGYEVVPEQLYRGDLVPMKYQAHFNAVLDKLRPRSYNGLLLTVDDRPFVCIGERNRFEPGLEGQQIKLFKD